MKAILASFAILMGTTSIVVAQDAAASVEDAPVEDAAAQLADVDAAMVVARVGAQEITLGHLIAAKAALPEQFQQIPAPQLFEGLVDQLVQQTLLEQSLEGDLPQSLALALENEERAIRAAHAIDLSVQDAVTEESLAAAYEERFAEFEPQPQFNASHILLETEQEANAVKAEIDGGADFAETAREKSTGPSGPNGGELGWFGEGMMVPEFEAAVMALEAGNVSEPVQTQFGWHVIKLNEIGETPKPTLQEVEAELSQEIQGKKVQELLESLQANGDVELMTDGLDPALIGKLELLDAQ